MPREHRVLFDRIAGLYDLRRPSYPAQVFGDLVALSGVSYRGRVLEIGCGTGQATLPMAEREYDIVAVELGANLAQIARRKLAAFANVRIETSAFEDFPLPDGRFDLVLSATSFHWLDHAVALSKIAAALTPGGSLAVIGGGHIAGGDTEFFNGVQDCYERHMPGTPTGLRLSDAADVPHIAPEIGASGLFAPPTYRRYTWLREFTTATYLGELNTYSSHIALPDEDREALLACIAERIDRDYGGHITKAYLTELAVARRL